jgi:hypothetical protein
VQEGEMLISSSKDTSLSSFSLFLSLSHMYRHSFHVVRVVSKRRSLVKECC